MSTNTYPCGSCMHLHSPMGDDPCRSCADGSSFVDWRQEIERLRAETDEQRTKISLVFFALGLTPLQSSDEACASILEMRAELTRLRAETAKAAQNERARCLSACDIVYDKFEKEWELDRAVGAYACIEAIQALPTTAAPSDPKAWATSAYGLADAMLEARKEGGAA